MARPFATDPGPLEHESAAGLFTRLFKDLTDLLRHEVALGKAELVRAANHAKIGAIEVALGAAVILAGILALLAAAILALAEVLAPWLSALIIGAVLLLAGLVMLQRAKRNLKPANFDLDRTRASVRSDVEVITRRS